MHLIEPRSRLYGRRKGRPMNVRKTSLMHNLLPEVQIELAACRKLDPRTLFPFQPKNIWLEIGFGGGEHLAAQAQLHPTHGFIGCEPFENGVASLLDHLDRDQITNVRIFPNDAGLLLDALPDACIERCYVLFADPWPKAKHASRRFIGPDHLPRLARVIKPEGELRLATDDTRLKNWYIMQMRDQTDFAETYHADAPPADWIPTRYEQKAIEAGRVPIYRSFRRR